MTLRAARRARAAVLASLLVLAPAIATAAERAEAVDRTTLRVCADPTSPPLSSEKGGGAEMRIAELFGRKLGIPVSYTWFPSGIGFYRRTLNVRRCDLVMSAAAGEDIALTTIPYYRSTYVLITRAADGIAGGDLRAPQMKSLRFGIQALTPGADLLAQAGLLDHARAYNLQNDGRSPLLAHTMLDDLAARRIDGVILWGPIGGYFAGLKPGAFRVTPLEGVGDEKPPVFDIAMAVRQGEPRWRDQINQLIRDNRHEIQDILVSYHIPLLPLPEDRP